MWEVSLDLINNVQWSPSDSFLAVHQLPPLPRLPRWCRPRSRGCFSWGWLRVCERAGEGDAWQKQILAWSRWSRKAPRDGAKRWKHGAPFHLLERGPERTEGVPKGCGRIWTTACERELENKGELIRDQNRTRVAFLILISLRLYQVELVLCKAKNSENSSGWLA